MRPTDQELQELYVRYGPVVLHRARSILRNDEEAQDAVQETFARVIVNWETFRGEASPLTWMFRITTNHCLNQLRNAQGRAAKRAQRHDELGGHDVAWMKDPREAEQVRSLLAEADPETQRVVLHLYFDDLTQEETARHLGLSVPTVRKRLRAFLERAQRYYGVGAFAVALALLLLGRWA